MSPRAARTRLAATLLLAVTAAACARAATPVTTDHRIAARDPGIELLVRNQHVTGLERVPAERVVLFVHGATFPASSTFGVDLPGGSWMSQLVSRSYDVYALDIRGYGGSTRPAAMSQPPEANPPFAGTREAVRDISAAVDFILARRHIRQLTLIGWSWGTTTVAAYAAENPDKVGKLVLVAPVWLGMNRPRFTGAYRTSTYESARAFATAGIPANRVEEISPSGTFGAWWAATQASDPEGESRSPPVVRSPNGVMQDFQDFWAAGKPAYEPANIRAPTLLIVGEWDATTPPSMAQGLYGKLVNARERRLILLSEGGHFMLIEKHRMRLIREVQNFLDET